MKRSLIRVILFFCLVAFALPGYASGPNWGPGPCHHYPDLAEDAPVGEIEPMAFFYGAMPTGVTVSRHGRMFVKFPQWGDTVEYTVAEVRHGKTFAYPNQSLNNCKNKEQKDCFVAVQSVVVDPKDRLWVLDTGSIGFGPTTYGGPKLVGIDLKTNKAFKWFLFPTDVALATTYLNDIRFDLTRGTEGMAFITDSGTGAIIVVDLADGKSWRRLANDQSTKALAGYLPMVEGKTLMLRPAPGVIIPLVVNSDGIAISNDGKKLYYSALTGRRLYSVSVDALANPATLDAAVAATVIDYGDKGCASDGLESDADGWVYLTDIEHNSIHRMKPDPDQVKSQASIETIAHDPRMLWPDTLSLAYDGYLYFTANQIQRQPVHTGGPDLRDKPYVVYRIKVNAKPVALK